MQKNVFVGSNGLRTRIGQLTCSSTHAEINVLMQYLRTQKIYKLTHVATHRGKKKLANATLIVVRNSNRINTAGDRVFNNSAPCPNCLKYLRMHGIGTIKYSDNINDKNVIVTI
jgi:deoxycytidylate deaminase